jgi:hypothetical protein
LNTITLCIPLSFISAAILVFAIACSLVVIPQRSEELLHFVFAVAFVFLVVIPEGDLRLSLSLLLPVLLLSFRSGGIHYRLCSLPSQ